MATDRTGSRPKVPTGGVAASRPDQTAEMRVPAPPIDPAADAAKLLRRLGFAILMLALPVAALLFRRGAVVLVPVGIALIIIATVLDGAHRKLGETAREAATAPAGLAAGLLLLWGALSLLWTPFQAPASERFLSVVATLALGAAGYLALPDRMRAANLYLLPIGAGLAALTAIPMSLLDQIGAARARTSAPSCVDSWFLCCSCGPRSPGCAHASVIFSRSPSRSAWRSPRPSVPSLCRSSRWRSAQGCMR
jgi:hypothetical protein